MKQLLIVNSTAALNAKNPSGSVTGKDLSGLKPGALAFGELGSDSVLSGPATKNFWIALGRSNGQVPFIIPEVDVRTLSIVKSTPVAAGTFSVTITLPAPDDVATLVNPTSMVHSPIAEYGITFIKKGCVPHERNTWHVNVATQTEGQAVLTDLFVNAINAKSSEQFPFSAVHTGLTLVVTCLNAGEDWDILFTDCLDSLNQSKRYTYTNGIVTDYSIGDNDEVQVTLGRKAIGDKADIQDLASRCAAGKGFTDTYRDGDTIYPNYPEAVEDSATYNVYTLRFRVGRDSAKTRDERVWQIVHIAVPVGATCENLVEGLLPVGNYMDNLANVNISSAIAAAGKN